MLTARSDGFKCKPFVLLKWKRADPKIVFDFKKSLELCWMGTTWMNDESTSLHLQKTLGSSLFGKRLLVWDSFRSHMSEKTKTLLRDLRLHSAIIPGGCTKVQPPGVSWNAPFKAGIRRRYEEWMAHGEKRLTRGGNVAAPPMEIYLPWIADSWRELPEDLIVKSFKQCGITVAFDGSEDDQIPCFKPHGQIPAGRQKLAEARRSHDLGNECNLSGVSNETDIDELTDDELLDDA
ncbi:uncharacterized protein LOC100898815 [Galendromus occidentalis]|uniref:Uncharacterized protein LOC100898815 n=1 Tax=Galendromus occidentalis TaxID=34638 RepID=A0AAJ7PAN3_9ACAR|nr:uncharacterized protein LOC100898815 [Galendromus occidentalis]